MVREQSDGGGEPLLGGDDWEDEADQKTDAQTEGEGTFFGGVMNMVNAAVGAGVLAFPFAISVSGIVLGPVLCIVFFMLIAASGRILGTAQLRTGTANYQEIVKVVLGDKMEKCIIMVQLLFLVGASIAYLQIFGDQLCPLLRATVSGDPDCTDLTWGDGCSSKHLIGSRPLVITVVTLLVPLPLCFLRTMQALAPMATISNIFRVWTVGVVVAQCCSLAADQGWPDIVADIPPAHDTSTIVDSTMLIQAVPLICFSYMAHPTYPLVFKELKGATLKKMDRLTVTAFGLCASVYIVIGFFGYTFCVMKNLVTPGDILTAFDSTWDVNVARLGIAVSVCASYAALHFAARLCVEDLLGKKLSPRENLLEILVFVALTLGAALVIEGLSIVLAFVGGVFIVALLFIFPGLLLERMAADDGQSTLSGRAVYLFGFVVMALSLYSTFKYTL